MGNIERARNILQAQWSKVNHAGQFDFALRELSALTRAAGAPMIAQAARNRRNVQRHARQVAQGNNRHEEAET